LLQKRHPRRRFTIAIANERMTLFMERITISTDVRITPISDDKNEYQNYVIAQIE
jgi:hypothetical protein